MRLSEGLARQKPFSFLSLGNAVLITFVVIFNATCNFPPTFGDEYRDSSTNFIAGLPLDLPPPATDDGSIIALESLAIWDWAWRGLTGTGNDFDYMTLGNQSTVGSTISSGSFTLASNAETWELELVNLAADPFCEGALHPGWESSGTGTLSSGAAIAASHGKFVRLQSDNANWVGFDPRDSLFISDDPASFVGNTYLLSAFSLKPTIRYLIGDNTIASFTETKASSINDSRHLFDVFPVPNGNTRFMVGVSNEDQDIDIDDIRILRTDIKEILRLRIRLAPQDVTPSLVAGKYEFSIWIKAPDLSLTYNDTGRITGTGFENAGFASPEMTLEMRQVRFLEAGATERMFRQTYPVTNSWTRVALRMDDNLDRFDETSTEAVLELSIYPFNPQDPEVGGVLIADPRLRFFIDGYTN